MPEETLKRHLDAAFVLLPGFSMMTWACAVEPLRQVNRLARAPLCRWTVLSADGAAVAASAGTGVVPDGPIGAEAAPEIVFVVAGVEIDRHPPDLTRWLRAHARRGTTVGALSTGTFALAAAGLLDDVPCTVHWESVEALRARYPRLDVTGRLYEIARRRITCAGASATLDLMLFLVAERFGAVLANAVASQFNYPALRLADAPQAGLPPPATLPAALVTAMAAMEASVADPVGVDEVARRAGVSARHLNRLFRSRLGLGAGAWLRRVRLRRARVLLAQTALPVIAVAEACGYASSSAFARAYRAEFGEPPRRTRERVRGHPGRRRHGAPTRPAT